VTSIVDNIWIIRIEGHFLSTIFLDFFEFNVKLTG